MSIFRGYLTDISAIKASLIASTLFCVLQVSEMVQQQQKTATDDKAKFEMELKQHNAATVRDKAATVAEWNRRLASTIATHERNVETITEQCASPTHHSH